MMGGKGNNSQWNNEAPKRNKPKCARNLFGGMTVEDCQQLENEVKCMQEEEAKRFSEAWNFNPTTQQPTNGNFEWKLLGTVQSPHNCNSHVSVTHIPADLRAYNALHLKDSSINPVVQSSDPHLLTAKKRKLSSASSNHQVDKNNPNETTGGSKLHKN